MAKQKLSYFEEKRIQYADPNFFNNDKNIIDMKQQMKRIIQDIKYNNIKQEDYIYFTNSKILLACIDACWQNYLSALAEYNAINYYINNGLYTTAIPQIATKFDEASRASTIAIKLSNKVFVWQHCYKVFHSIYNGWANLDILSTIQNFSSNQLTSI